MDRRSLLRLAMLGIAVAVLYGAGLDHTPAHLHRDEMSFAIQAQSIADTGHDLDGRFMPLYFRMPNLGELTWFHPFMVYAQALLLQVLPFTEAVSRIPAVIVAVVDVLLMYFVARRVFGTAGWGFGAAALLAMTPAHFVHGRLAFDFIFPLPFVLTWLLCLLIHFEGGRPLMLFGATSALGAGFFSYVASMIMMPIYLALTGLALLTSGKGSPSRYLLAVSGFAWPLLILVPWLSAHPTFFLDLLNRYDVGAASLQNPVDSASIVDVVTGIRRRLSLQELQQRVSLYWGFFDPGFLFLMGGYTRMTNSTRLVGVFLASFIVLVPVGLAEILTRRATPITLAIVLGFVLAPVAASLTVLEPYASDRELAILVFGVLIAIFGIQRLLAVRGRWGRAFTWGVLALIPLHFVFFLVHYFGDYHRRSAFWFEWNHRGGLEAIIAREPRTSPRPVFLTVGDETQMEGYWRLSLVKHGRQDLMAHTTYFDAKTLDLAWVPHGSLMLITREDRPILDWVARGEMREVLKVPEPADDPFFLVLERP